MKRITIKQYQQAADTSVSIGGIKWLDKWDVCVRCDSREEAEALKSRLAQQEEKPGHDLKDTRCECCGYMTYHSEHMGCIRAAIKQEEKPEPEPVAWNKSIRDSVDSLLAQASFEPDSSVRHQLAMMNFESTTVPLKNWRNALPGGRHTGQWESGRVADYNKGWNEYRKAAKAALEKLEVAPPQPQQKEQEPVAWMHTTATGETYFRKNRMTKYLIQNLFIPPYHSANGKV